MKSKYVWMMVTRDIYELPIYICDTARELSEMCGHTPNAIYSCVAHSEKKNGFSRFRKVVIDE